MKRLHPAVALAVAVASGCSSPATATGPGALPAAPAVRTDPAALSAGRYIKHVVIVIQENRSLENFFAGWPGADAPMSGGYKACKTCAPRQLSLHQTNFKGTDLVHSYQGAMVSIDGGTMDGFGLPLLGANRPTGTVAYAYVAHNLIAPYRTMASEYTLADHMFPDELGASFTGHLNAIAGTTDLTPIKALVDMPTSGPWGCDAPEGTETWTVDPTRTVRLNGPFPCLSQFRTMADTLDAAQVSWKYYEPQVNGGQGSWSAFDAIENVRYGPDWDRSVLAATPQTLALTDPAQGKLPSVAWVTPDFHDSDHLNSQSDTGPSWVAAVVNAVGKSPNWSSTAIVVVWDDWGGWYDNAKPPNLDFRGLGIRVPCLIISPYARKHYVSHTVYEFSSILKFVEQTFRLPPLGPTSAGYTDTRANSIVDSFDFTQAPRKFVQIPAKYPTSYFLTKAPSYLPLDDE